MRATATETDRVREAYLRAALEGYPLARDGVHGLRHWGRVLESGRRLAEATPADLRVVELFALFHDCRRVNEEKDPGHGLRGGEVARTLYDTGVLAQSANQFELLHYACEHHTAGLVEGDPTAQTCWDADRLDLGRVGIRPEPRYLCTSAARDPAMIAWAEERARGDHQLAEVETWGSWGKASRGSLGEMG